MKYVILLILISASFAIDILQLVPGFTNSHLLFNYRLATTLSKLGHDVKMWTQMEVNMVSTGVSKPPNITELRIPIHFSDKMNAEGLKVFQTMMFKKNDEYDLWWTGQQFKDMRTEACEQMLRVPEQELEKLFQDQRPKIAIGHFHDLCPLGLAKKALTENLIWITHGTSLYDFAAAQMGIRTYPSYVPHPLSSYGDRMNFIERVFNSLWCFSTLDFVNLPLNLLYEENNMYRRLHMKDESDLWDLSRKVPVTLINGEEMLDFPKPLTLSIAFIGQLGKLDKQKSALNSEFRSLVDSSDLGFIIFSFGTVCNTSSMPIKMRKSFLKAFASFRRYTILWRFEDNLPEAENYKHIKLFSWLPQKELMDHPKMKLLIAHGGYNSFLESCKAGVPALLMPLFADQFINVRRAERFGLAESLDKTKLTADIIEKKMKMVLNNPRYKEKAMKLSQMLEDKPTQNPTAILSHRLRMSLFKRNYYSLKTRDKFNFIQHHLLDVIILPMILVWLLM